MVAELQEEIGEFGFRVFVDSAPVLERSWARKSGIGWVGKNANLITKQNGSFIS
jgi:epoxyqueuosine reductase